jgi:hypothetical protein
VRENDGIALLLESLDFSDEIDGGGGHGRG